MKADRSHPLKVIAYIVVVITAFCTLTPFILIVSGSFSTEKELIRYGVGLLPRAATTDAYRFLFTNSRSIVTGYRVTVTITVAGTLASLALTASLAYVTSVKTLRLRNAISFFIYFTMIFNGGLIPYYILIVRYLKIKNTLLALILPMLISSFNVMIMRTYFRGLPDSLRESALMDGASEFRILVRIILPISLPIMATVSLFYMLSYWNDWYNALLFVDSKNLVPLQFNMYRILSVITYMSSTTEMGRAASQYAVLPAESVRMATAVVTIGPIILVYPFLQKHFVKGIAIGAIKG